MSDNVTKISELHREERAYVLSIRKEFKTWLITERAKIISVDDIVPWFMSNQGYIMQATNAIVFADNYNSRNVFKPGDRFANIILSIRYSPDVPNSHVCPDDGETNWSKKDYLTTSYPGWIGTVAGALIRSKDNMYSYPYSAALNIVGLKTGTGGGGNAKWHYGVSLFLEDWPGLEQELLVNKLRGII